MWIWMLPMLYKKKIVSIFSVIVYSLVSQYSSGTNLSCPTEIQMTPLNTRSTLPGTSRAKIFNQTIDTGDVVKSEELTISNHPSGKGTFKQFTKTIVDFFLKIFHFDPFTVVILTGGTSNNNAFLNLLTNSIGQNIVNKMIIL